MTMGPQFCPHCGAPIDDVTYVNPNGCVNPKCPQPYQLPTLDLINNRPPDRIFHYGPPDNLDKADALIRPICERINQSGWLWTVESCEGHQDGLPDPMIRFGLRTEYVGHLVLLMKRACGTDYRLAPTFYAGWCPDEEWSDFLTTIAGDMPLVERRQCYARLAELANEHPPILADMTSGCHRFCPNS